MLTNALKMKGEPFLIAALIAYAVLIGSYWVARYGGTIIEGDTTRLSLAGAGIREEGTLTPSRNVYHAGYGYPVLLAVFSEITGVSIVNIQSYSIFPPIAIATLAYITYRALLHQPGIAALATFFLLAQPDFVFYILRGSHERLTWLFLLMLLFITIRSYKVQHSAIQFGLYVLSFYIVFFGMTVTTAYFASTVFTSFAISFLLGWVLMRIDRYRNVDMFQMKEFVARLPIASAACLITVFMFITYIYSPAASYYTTLSSMADRTGTLILGVEPVIVPYNVVAPSWRNPIMYFALIAIQAGISGLSVLAWVLRGAQWLVKGWDEHTRERGLFWLLYCGIAVQMLAGISLDFAGFLGSNLQLRLFPAFAIFACPLAAELTAAVYRGTVRRFPRVRKAALALVSAVAVYAIMACLIKVTNDPLVSNLWLFYSRAEERAADWVEQYIEFSVVWVDTWSHKHDMLLFKNGYGWVPKNSYIVRSGPEVTAEYFARSKLTELRARQGSLVLPSAIDSDIVYDNGEVRVYHRIPSTPYQR